MNTKESWYKLNFIVVGSKFNSPCYSTQAEKCPINSNLNLKGRFSEFFAKFNNFHKMKTFVKKSLAKWREKKKDQVSFTNLYSWPFKLSPKLLKNVYLKNPLMISRVLRKPTAIVQRVKVSVAILNDLKLLPNQTTIIKSRNFNKDICTNYNWIHSYWKLNTNMISIKHSF